MRDQLIQYVNLLFAGAPDSDDIRQEILQNTLDRYDDLVAQGKSPEAAYRLAITGIGDINEILGSDMPGAAPVYKPEAAQVIREESDRIHKRILRAVAVALYILCPTPLFVLGEMGMDTIGLCGTLAIIAVATVLIILAGKKGRSTETFHESEPLTPQQEIRKSIISLIWAIGLAVYLILSFATGAWYITWVLFPMIACVKGLVNACMDLKEAIEYEN